VTSEENERTETSNQVLSNIYILQRESDKRFSTSGYFHESVSPRLGQAPEYSIRAVSHFYENSRGF
jgi:hypothetical protein